VERSQSHISAHRRFGNAILVDKHFILSSHHKPSESQWKTFGFPHSLGRESYFIVAHDLHHYFRELQTD
jgi:hypothetical protein